MTTRSYTFDGGTAAATVAIGSPLAAGDNAWAAVQVPAGGSFTFDTDRLNGSLAGKLVIPSGVNGYARWSETAHTAGAKSASYKVSVVPTTGEYYLLRCHSGATLVWAASLINTGFLRLRHTSGDNIWTSTTAVPIGSWFTIDVAYTIAGASSTIQCRFYNSTGALLQDSGSITYDLGSLSVDTPYFGSFGNVGNAVTISVDNARANDAAATLFGPPGETVVTYSGTVSTTGWTATGGTAQAVLADTDAATKLTSIDTPTNATCFFSGTLPSISPPPAGGFTVRVNGRRVNSTSGTYTAKLFVGGVEQASTTAAIPTSLQDTDVIFSSASISGITSASWSSGVRLDILAAAN